MHGAEAVGETRVVGARIHQVGHADLLDASKTLEIRVFNNVEMQLVRDADEAIDRVVEDFLFVGRSGHRLKFCCKGNAFFVKYAALGWQASTGMSSLGRLVGKGKGSIAVEAVMLRLLHFAPPSIDSMPSHMPSQE